LPVILRTGRSIGNFTKGNLKLAITTNGKAPTTAKRLRQFFEDVIPDDINELLENLNIFRTTIKVTLKRR
jgi:precorrin-2 dehydrogenase/sirohydrochlorin ferrochelatase